MTFRRRLRILWSGQRGLPRKSQTGARDGRGVRGAGCRTGGTARCVAPGRFRHTTAGGRRGQCGGGQDLAAGRVSADIGRLAAAGRFGRRGRVAAAECLDGAAGRTGRLRIRQEPARRGSAVARPVRGRGRLRAAARPRPGGGARCSHSGRLAVGRHGLGAGTDVRAAAAARGPGADRRHGPVRGSGPAARRVCSPRPRRGRAAGSGRPVGERGSPVGRGGGRPKSVPARGRTAARAHRRQPALPARAVPRAAARGPARQRPTSRALIARAPGAGGVGRLLAARARLAHCGRGPRRPHEPRGRRRGRRCRRPAGGERRPRVRCRRGCLSRVAAAKSSGLPADSAEPKVSPTSYRNRSEGAIA